MTAQEEFTLAFLPFFLLFMLDVAAELVEDVLAALLVVLELVTLLELDELVLTLELLLELVDVLELLELSARAVPAIIIDAAKPAAILCKVFIR